MNDVAMNSPALGQTAAYLALQSMGMQEEPAAYTMDFSDVLDGGSQTTLSGNTALMGRCLGWGSGHVIVDAGGSRHMKVDSYTQVDFDTGTVTAAAFSDFFASAGNSAAAASLRSSVSFSAGYLPGQLRDTISALSSAYHAQRELSQSGGGEQLEALDRLYAQGKDIAIVSFAKSVGGFLDRYANSGQQDKLYRSAHAAVTVLEGGIRSAQAGDGGLYTLEELDFAAVSVNTCKTLLENTQNGDGVRQKLCLNRLELETRSMAAQGQIGGGLADLLCSVGRLAFQEAFAAVERIPSPKEGVDLRG